MTLLELQNVGFGYNSDPPLFSNVNMQVNAGECVAITGESGCGKSTLCLISAGIIPRSFDGKLYGTVRLLGDDIKTLSLAETISRIGMVFQNPDSQLFAPTVEDELAFAPENLCLPRDEIDRRISSALKTVGMEKHRFSSPSQLSGGQKQLIALAAVLTLEPEILIFDEAMSQLDESATAGVKRCIAELKKQGKAILAVEHDEENLDIADRLYKFTDGKLLAYG